MYKKTGTFDLGDGYIIIDFVFTIKSVNEGFTEVWFWDKETGLTSSRNFETEDVLSLDLFANSVPL